MPSRLAPHSANRQVEKPAQTIAAPAMKLRDAPFALRLVRRKAGTAAIPYRRRLDDHGRDRLQKVAALSPLAYTSGLPLLRAAVQGSRGAAKPGSAKLAPGPFLPLDHDWGARVACYALVAAGLKNGDRLTKAARNLREADPAEASWWLGRITREDGRALRALRILTEAVQ